MSLFSRKTSEISFDKDSAKLVINDGASSFKWSQILILLTSSIPLILIFMEHEPSSFWFSLFMGAYLSFALWAIYHYLFVASTSKEIHKDQIRQIVIIKLILANEKRLSIELKNGKYRNLIINHNECPKSLITTFEEIGLTVNERKSYQITPLNY